ncbi:hypothetical protein H6790_00915 [Candidatus Nomurabacteria bacterium]|nr:hypothetical protein [Candidatus Nomurabacteria bacterium]MCB9820492.1 hypothetical protein [Candidatus Nomurabacteria bacterium]
MKDFIEKIKTSFKKKDKEKPFKKKKAYRKKDLSFIWKVLILSFFSILLLLTIFESITFLKLSKKEFVFTDEELAGFVSDDNYGVLSGIVDRFTKKKEVFEDILGKPMFMDESDIQVDSLSDTDGGSESVTSSVPSSTSGTSR